MSDTLYVLKIEMDKSAWFLLSWNSPLMEGIHKG